MGTDLLLSPVATSTFDGFYYNNGGIHSPHYYLIIRLLNGRIKCVEIVSAPA